MKRPSFLNAQMTKRPVGFLHAKPCPENWPYRTTERRNIRKEMRIEEKIRANNSIQLEMPREGNG